mgnify:CR=1 FL=1
MGRRPKILVVGSLVMDLIVSTERFPDAGETVLGFDYSMASGGKGANQAVQAARLGADVTMYGRIGEDDIGQRMLESVSGAGVDTANIRRTPGVSSAIGNVQLEVQGEKTMNRIIVVSGANMRIIPEDVSELKEGIAAYDMVILQHEIPMAINELVAAYAYAKGVPVMLNTAPSAPVSPEMLSHITYISPNEFEAADLSGVQVLDEASARYAVEVLLEKGVKNVLITRGSAGAVLGNDHEFISSPCVYCEHVQDPTAAGDSFVGAFCCAVCLGATNEEALLFANCAAHITVSVKGAQPSLPTLEQVIGLMRAKGFDVSPYQTLCMEE